MAERFDFAPAPDPAAVAFLEGKGLQRSWRWPSMWQSQHAFAFTLAGVHRLDVLGAGHQLVTDAVKSGETLETFKAKFRDRMGKLGFAGPQIVREFAEGPRKVDLTAPWRMRVIYDTNVRQAYAAAEWAAIEDTRADFPALQYQGVRDERTRASHRQWFGVTRLVGDPFWKTHYPPNDWYCRCFVIQVSVDELAAGAAQLTTDEALAESGFNADPASWPEWRHGPTGRTDRVPPGVAPGFANNAGLNRREALAELVQRRVEDLPAALARAASADVVNLPLFHDLATDAVRTGIARHTAGRAAAQAARSAGQSAAEAATSAARAAEAAGSFPKASLPIGWLPVELAGERKGLVVVNASGIGHSASQHPTTPGDWARVQRLAENGEAWTASDGELLLLGVFVQGGAEQTWAAALKAVDGGWRVRTLFPTSPRRRAALTRGKGLLRPDAGPIDWR